jgi:hypothetical protein
MSTERGVGDAGGRRSRGQLFRHDHHRREWLSRDRTSAQTTLPSAAGRTPQSIESASTTRKPCPRSLSGRPGTGGASSSTRGGRRHPSRTARCSVDPRSDTVTSMSVRACSTAFATSSEMTARPGYSSGVSCQTRQASATRLRAIVGDMNSGGNRTCICSETADCAGAGAVGGADAFGTPSAGAGRGVDDGATLCGPAGSGTAGTGRDDSGPGNDSGVDSTGLESIGRVLAGSGEGELSAGRSGSGRCGGGTSMATIPGFGGRRFEDTRSLSWSWAPVNGQTERSHSRGFGLSARGFRLGGVSRGGAARWDADTQAAIEAGEPAKASPNTPGRRRPTTFPAAAEGAATCPAVRRRLDESDGG